MKTKPFIVCLVWFGINTVAGAFDIDFPSARWVVNVTETLVFDWHGNNRDGKPEKHNDHYGDVQNRLNLNLDFGEFTLWTRVDTATFIQTSDSAKPQFVDQVRPEKISLAYTNRNLSLRLGDFYATFGRGIALNIRKSDELGLDTTLLGAKARLDLGVVQGTILSGLVNPTNVDGMVENTVRDTLDLISGVQTLWRLPRNISWGLHGVWTYFDPFHRQLLKDFSNQNFLQQTFVAGSSLEFTDLGGIAALFAEFDWMGRQTRLVQVQDQQAALQPPGPLANRFAGYMSLNLFLDNWTILLEAKSYRDFDLYSQTPGPNDTYLIARLDYIQPPTLEPSQAEISNNRDLTGGKLQIDWRPRAAATLLFASYAAFLGHDFSDSAQQFIYHARVGIEHDFFNNGRATVSIGFREENPDSFKAIARGVFDVEAALKMPLTANHSLDVHGFHWWCRLRKEGSTNEYLKGEWVVSYSWVPWLDLAFILGYDTQLENKRQLFLSGSLGLKLWRDQLVIKLKAGSMRGGLKCWDGSCREIPSFAGVHIETSVLF